MLGSALAVLVRSPNPCFDSDMADLVSPLNGDRDDDYHTRSLLTCSNLFLQCVQYSSPARPVSTHSAAEQHAGSFSWPRMVCPDGSDPSAPPQCHVSSSPAQGSGPQYSPGSIHLFPSRGTPLYPEGGEKDQRKRRDKWRSEARNGSKVPRLASCSSFSVLSKSDRDIFKSFAGDTTAVGRIAMT